MTSILFYLLLQLTIANAGDNSVNSFSKESPTTGSPTTVIQNSEGTGNWDDGN